MRFIIALAAAALLATPTIAQKGGFRSPSISRPMTVSRPAPSYSRPAYRPAPAVTRPAPVAQIRRPAPVRAVAQASRAPQIVGRPVDHPQIRQRGPVGRAVGRPIQRRYSYRGSSWAWTAPAIMPVWWMSTMNRPYSFDSYDDFIRQCLRTPPRQRSRECVIALRDRGIRG